MKKRLTALFLLFLLLLQELPVAALAAEDSGVPDSAVVGAETETTGISVSTPVVSSRMVDYGDATFYIKDNSVFYTDWISEQEVDGLDGAAQLAINGDSLYFTTEDDVASFLYRYAIKGGSVELVRAFDPWMGSFCMFGSYLYYRVDTSIFRCDMRTGEIEAFYSNGKLEDFTLNQNGHVLIKLTEYAEEVEEGIDWCGIVDADNKEVRFGEFDTLYYSYGGDDVELSGDWESVGAVSGASSSGITDWTYSTKINGKSVPFSEYGEGTYFTTTGKACVSHNSCKYYGGGWQCYGFALYAFDKLFGYTAHKYYNTAGKYYSSAGKGTVWDEVLFGVRKDSITANYLKSIFGDKVLPGAHIRSGAGSNGYQHSLVYIGSNSEYIWTYEGNADGRCGVYIKKRTWDEMVTYLTQTKYGIAWVASPICKHSYSNASGLCTKCGAEYYLNVTYGNQGIYVNKLSNLLTSISVYEKPYTGAKKTRLSMMSRITVVGTVKNAGGESWYKSTAGYITSSDFSKLTKLMNYIPSIVIEPTAAPSGTLTSGSSYGLKGTIRTTNGVPIQSITAQVFNAATGSAQIGYTVRPNSVSYSIGGSTLDSNIKFGTLPANSTYYLQYTVTDMAGGTATKRCSDFTVVQKNAVAAPLITPTNINGGVSVAFSCTDRNATIHYRVNNGAWSTVSASAGKTLTYTAAGSYTFSAYTTRTGYTTSSTKNQSLTIAQTAAPVISEPVYSGNAAYVTITGNGLIYYTTDGTVPTTTSAKYSGAIQILGNCTIRAMCLQSGNAMSAVASRDVVVSVPGTPSVKVENTKIAQGESAVVSWIPVDTATSYIACLYADGVQIKAVETAGTTAAFEIDGTGSYSITVTASNMAGSGEESAAVTVEVMRDLLVRFLDYDRSTVLSEQAVRYGGTATQPQIPQRTGYTFSGWDNYVFAKLYEDTDFIAQYQINKYTVRFFESDGTLLSTQRVEHGSAATPPATSIPEGYVLAGWCVENNSEGLDYLCVTADMDLTASYQWGNKDLPVLVKLTSAVYKESAEGPYYDCVVSIKNNDESLTRGRLLAVIQTSDGRTLETHIEDISLPQAASIDEEYTPFTFTINSNEVGTVVKAVVLGTNADNDDQTGGTYSEMVSGDVTPEVTYSDWSGWSTSAPPPDAAVVETTTQYRYRSKATTTVTNSTLPEPWTQTGGDHVSYGDWSAWSTAYVGASSTREVQTNYVAATYKTQYRYIRYSGKLNSAGASLCGASVGASWSHFCPTWARKYMSSYSTSYTPWLDSPLTVKSKQVCSCHGVYGIYKYNNISYYGLASNGYYQAQTVVNSPAYTQYRYRTVTTTRDYWKWGDWSAWTDVAPASYGSYDDYEAQTLYRYKTSATGAEPVESSTNEEIYTVTGRLEPDLAGKLATVLVYKKTNTDPTQSQLEYVDQFEIEEDGAYSITVKAKEALDSVRTGDFVVSLAVEGATRLVNAATINAPRPVYTVNLYMNGQLISTQEIEEGDSVQIPAETAIPEGYTLTGWDESLANITQNLDIHAEIEPMLYTVTLVDWMNSSISMVKAKYGDAIPVPENDPTAVGQTFVGWDLIRQGTYVVTEDMLLTAEWEAKTFKVSFEDGQGNTIEIQEVEFGKAATLPSKYAAGDTIGSYIFAGWSNDTCWWEVADDIVVFPILLSENTMVAPLASLADGAETAPTYMELFSSKDSATVYYSLNREITLSDVENYLNPDSNNGNVGTTDDEAVLTLLSENIIESEYEEFIDESEPALQICEYTEPILLSDSSVIYTFQVSADGTVSDIAAYTIYVTDEGDEEILGMGDANQDGKIDTKDITRILNYVVGNDNSIDYLNADTNRDEEISVIDALRLMKHLAGWDVALG